MIGGHVPSSGSVGPVGCRGAIVVMVVVWVMLGAAALVVWSLMREVG